MCNCCRSDSCPLTENVVYRAEAKVEDLSMMTYIGLTKGAFKGSCSNNVTSFRLRKYCNITTLSKYVWKIKDVTWDIVGKIVLHEGGGCNLCQDEKLGILMFTDPCSLITKKDKMMTRYIYILKNFYYGTDEIHF